MSRTERLIVEAVLTLILIFIPAFVLHTSPRFAGSLAGFTLGTGAALLMLALLIYPLAKYDARLKAWLARVASMRALLTFHVYAGVFGTFLAILHTGHKYQSVLGIMLVITMLLVVGTGFVGRYYLPETSTELREDRSRLASLRSAYDSAAAALAERHLYETAAADNITAPALRDTSVLQLVDAIADLENAIGSREALKAVFLRWIVAHVVTAILMYSLLTLHIAGEIYYGLRWLA